MPSILNRVPIPEHDDIGFVGTEHVRLKAYEIIVWVSLTLKETQIWQPLTPCFPAILDTGHTHNFSIQEQHLIRWANLRPQALDRLGDVRHGRRRLPRHAAHVWLHRNVPGKRDRMDSVPPYCLQLPRGITIYPAGPDDFPRLPLLGSRALLASELHLAVNGKKKWANLRSEDWWARMLGWLS